MGPAWDQIGTVQLEANLTKRKKIAVPWAGQRETVGGNRPPNLDRGFFIEPTVFANVDNGSTIAREEIFGPVLSVIPADSEAQAVAIANDSIYGLNASVFTDDDDRAYEVARQIRSGTVGQNACPIDFGIAFGGFKQSGVGREGGRRVSTRSLRPRPSSSMASPVRSDQVAAAEAVRCRGSIPPIPGECQAL